MERVIIEIQESVEIAAPPPAVFAVVSDPQAKLALNPFVEVIRVEREGVGEGAVTFLRFQKGHRFIEYRTCCVAYERDRLVESAADLPTLFRVRVELAPVAAGTRLTQGERCEVTPDMLEHVVATQREQRAWRTIKLMNLVFPGLVREAFSMIFHERVDAVRKTMSMELYAWLDAIRRHVEARGEAVRSAGTP
jgi:hypothetical protein